MPTITLDAVDQRILEVLQADGRISNVALADEVGLSPSPCLRRVKRLEDEGVITGYRAVVDRAVIGLGLTVFLDVMAERHSAAAADALEDAFAAMPEVVSCHVVSGEADFRLEVVCTDLQDYDRFTREQLQVLPNVAHF